MMAIRNQSFQLVAHSKLIIPLLDHGRCPVAAASYGNAAAKSLLLMLLSPAGNATISARDDANCRWHYLRLSASASSLPSPSYHLHPSSQHPAIGCEENRTGLLRHSTFVGFNWVNQQVKLLVSHRRVAMIHLWLEQPWYYICIYIYTHIYISGGLPSSFLHIATCKFMGFHGKNGS
jgi:hypothetical protein